jgi:hypothetical protein
MKEILLCLSFMQAPGTSTLQVPRNVDEIVKKRVEKQVENQNPEIDLRFDDSNCEQKAQYLYTVDSLRLEGDNSLWSGSFEASISDLLDGKRFEFPLVAEHESEQEQPAAEEKTKTHSSWLVPSLAAMGVGVLTFFAARHFSSNNRDDPTPEQPTRVRVR